MIVQTKDVFCALRLNLEEVIAGNEVRVRRKVLLINLILAVVYFVSFPLFRDLVIMKEAELNIQEEVS